MKRGAPDVTGETDEVLDERLKHIDPKMVELVLSEVRNKNKCMI